MGRGNWFGTNAERNKNTVHVIIRVNIYSHLFTLQVIMNLQMYKLYCRNSITLCLDTNTRYMQKKFLRWVHGPFPFHILISISFLLQIYCWLFRTCRQWLVNLGERPFVARLITFPRRWSKGECMTRRSTFGALEFFAMNFLSDRLRLKRRETTRLTKEFLAWICDFLLRWVTVRRTWLQRFFFFYLLSCFCFLAFLFRSRLISSQSYYFGFSTSRDRLLSGRDFSSAWFGSKYKNFCFRLLLWDPNYWSQKLSILAKRKSELLVVKFLI